MTKLNKLLAFLSIILSLNISAQDIDSLLNIFNSENKHDSVRANAINDATWNIMFSKPDSASKLAALHLSFSEEKNDETQQAKALNNMGISYAIQGKTNLAESKYNKALKISKSLNDLSRVASIYNNLGILYKDQNNLSKAISFFHKALSTHEKNKDYVKVASTLNNIGTIYFSQSKLKKAEDYFNDALSYSKNENDPSGMANVLMNLALIDLERKSYSSAKNLLREVAEIRLSLNQIQGLAEVNANLGGIFIKQIPQIGTIDYQYKISDKALLDSAEKYYRHALKLAKSVNSTYELSDSYSGLGQIYLAQEDLSQAEDNFLKSVEIADNLGYVTISALAHHGFYLTQKKLENTSAALVHLEKSVELQDSINDIEEQKKLLQSEIEFEYEKEALAKQKEQEKKDAIQKLILYSIIGGLILVLIFTFFLINRFRIISKQKRLIEEQKQEVEKQFAITEQQKKEIEEINSELTDSINYAQKIQGALLKSADEMESQASDYFNIFKPKDIVSGDFYWGAVRQNHLYVACVDCTGHGVPGAFMSMLGMSFLNEILSTKEILNTDEILNLLRNKIIKELNQTGGEGQNKDGMDLVLYRLDYSKEDSVQLQVSFANNSLYLITDNDTVKNTVAEVADKTMIEGKHTLYEIKGDKQPIGYYPGMKPFTRTELNLIKGVRLYATSDGFLDQFGGSRNKKFMSKNFKKLLLEVQEFDYAAQKNILNERFETYKGDISQLDDVCVIGIEI